MAIERLCFALALMTCACQSAPSKEDVPLGMKRQALLGGQNDLAYWMDFENPTYTSLSMATALPLTSPSVYGVHDEGVATIPLNDPMDATFGALNGFKFEFYGRKVSTVFVSVNGLVTFDDHPGPYNYANDSIFSVTAGMAIAAWWDDMQLSSPYNSSDLTFKLDAGSTPRTLSFEWKNLRHYLSTQNPRKMKVTLFEATPGHENSNAIRVSYEPLSASVATDSATVGIKNEAGTSASTETLACTTGCNEQSHWPLGTHTYRPAPHVYIRNTSSATYSPISGGTDVTPTDLTDGFAEVNLPFSFSYFGKQYQKVFVSVKGLIAFEEPPTSGLGTNIAVGNSAAPNNFIAPWWDDLYLPDAMDANPGSIQVKAVSSISGFPPDQFVVQWKNLKTNAMGGALHDMQVRLLLSPGIGTNQVIEVHYGPVSGNQSNDAATIGLEDEGGTTDGSFKATSDCSPTCGSANWSADTVHRYTRPTFTHLYNNYFTQTGPKTLHCFSCHYNFREDPQVFPFVTPVPASQSATYAQFLFNQIQILDHTAKVTGTDGMGHLTTTTLSDSENPLCGDTPPPYSPSSLTEIFTTFNGHLNPLWTNSIPGLNIITWMNRFPSGSMPFDCACSGEELHTGAACAGDYTNEKGRRELLTWWAEGAQNN